MEIVKYLIPKFGDRKFDLTNTGNTCLHYAALEGHLAVVKYLIEECGFNPNLANKVGCYMYVYSVCYYHMIKASRSACELVGLLLAITTVASLCHGMALLLLLPYSLLLILYVAT